MQVNNHTTCDIKLEKRTLYNLIISYSGDPYKKKLQKTKLLKSLKKE